MDAFFDAPADPRPALPEPQRERWQPLRLGLVELFMYDSEEFWFRDGHLLLRGNNGTGKSKVLSLTLPFLLDASLHSSRIEPDGDSTKKMAWNLLLGNYDRRIGYAWIEFGRRDADGNLHYLTLGAGLSAVAARARVDPWFFILDAAIGGHRIGRDLWLTNDQQVVLTRERLREAIEGHGQLFDVAVDYRRAVDERLFQLGTRRYDALIDTLIQLRQPQLSRKPDEAGLSHALTEALPPMPQELLGDVAEALNQLEEDRRQLDSVKQLASAVDRFDQRYRGYAGMQSRRQARQLRQAQTEFDQASQQRNQAQAALQTASAGDQQALAAHESADRSLAAARARHDTLQSDPTTQDAKALEFAGQNLERRRHAQRSAQAASAEARGLLQRAQDTTLRAVKHADAAERELLAARAACRVDAANAGVATFLVESALTTLPPPALAELTAQDFTAAPIALRSAVAARRDQLQLLQRRHEAARQAGSLLAQRQQARTERRHELTQASERRTAADRAAEQAGQLLVEAWTRHCAALVQLRFDDTPALQALNDWVLQPDMDNPVRQALSIAQQQTQQQQAARRLEHQTRQDTLQQEREALEAERERLNAGIDAVPPPPHTRAADTRSGMVGAPLWQLVDFHEHVRAEQRAGLEAALEAAGLLDAWITPDGRVLAQGNGDSEPWLDQQWIERTAWHGETLAGWLRADVTDLGAVAPERVERLLAAVACAADDPGTAESWIAPDGRFRLGALAGAWAKPQALYIGHAARALARQRRLEEIAARLEALRSEQQDVARQFERLAADQRQAELEWRNAPSEQPLRKALLDVQSSAREFQTAQQRLEQAEAAYREADDALQAARAALQRDAIDMRLPLEPEALPEVESALQHFNDAGHDLLRAAQQWRSAGPELLQQQAREAESFAQLQRCEETLAANRLEADEAQARFEVLQQAVGAQVESLREQLHAARQAVDSAVAAQRLAGETRLAAGKQMARASAVAETAEAALNHSVQARATAVAELQRFARSTLLSSALPAFDLPDLTLAWTIDPALSLARRVEQALSHIQDDEPHWSRVQRQIAEDLTELQRALSALGHQAPTEPNEFGFVVHIVVHNRPERPDQLAARLADDIAQRSELLSAQEREVLENHLQAEIASEVQRRLRAAEQQVGAINEELHKRPTSTGVRYRLQWQPLGENEGAPVGLAAARERLLHTSADLWSAEDRRVVGGMLQQRIDAERERSDADLGRSAGDGGSSLIDQLARALDYRRWHQFRVQRLQDGQWKKLSGPASSGERALGLTVPLFAAIASFYSQGSSTHAPRLMLLDEAFAGIDDAARAHCMGLIRAFDLDFVITSEREWACYAELPGVSICQLQRREGVDAVFVSRWTWDGKAKRRDADPDRRLPPE